MPLRWRVLHVDKAKDRILVISEKIIDACPFTEDYRSYRATMWSRSTVRKRMQSIYDQCFTEEEKSFIMLTYYRIDCTDSEGNKEVLDESEDYLFAPTRTVAETYFEEDRTWVTKHGSERPCKNLDRLCEVTETAIKNELGPDEEEERYRPLSSSAYSAYWILTPPKRMDDWQLCVSANGQISVRDSRKPLGIRPCMYLKNMEYPVSGTFRYEETPVIETPHKYDTVQIGQWDGRLLQWLILDKETDRTLVMSEKGIVPMPFHDGWTSARHYGVCHAREWINGEFFEKAFTEEERERICVTTVHIPKSPTDISKWEGPEDCNDHMFLLLYDEVKDYFPSHIDLFCYPLSGRKEPVGWWLRDHCTLADQEDAIAERWTDDYYTRTYLPQSRKDVYVRPAMWIRNTGEELYDQN